MLLTSLTLSADADPREAFYQQTGHSVNDLRIKSQQLGQWCAELASQGLVLPTEIYPAIYQATHASSETPPDESRRLHNLLDGYAKELSILEDDPGQLGSARLSLSKLAVVGEEVEITQTITIGMPLTVGAGILVTKHWQHNIRLQVNDPGRPNYIWIEAGNPEVKFAAEGVTRRGKYGSPYGLVELPLFVITAGQLQPGDRVIVHYGSRSNGITLPTSAAERYAFPLYFQQTPQGHFFSVPVEHFPIQPGKVSQLGVYTPSLLSAGEYFSLMVRAEDQYGNLSQGVVPSLDMLVDGVYKQRIASTDNPLLRIDGLVFSEEGQHIISVRSGGGGLIGTSNAILVERQKEFSILWANLNAHSALSDGLRSPEELRSESSGEYDVILIADHDSYLPEDSSGIPASLVARRVDLPLKSGGHSSWINPVQRIALPEVPADHRVARGTILTEIFSGVSSYEWFGNAYANKGYRVGFTASPSAHIPSRDDAAKTAIIVLSDETWQEALGARRTFVSSGPRSVLKVRVNGAYPGARVPLAERRVIAGEVYALNGVDDIQLLRNGIVIDKLRQASSENSAIAVKISLHSTSEPFSPGFDLPRNGREWLGFLKVKGAKISSVSAPGFDNQSRAAVAINPSDPQRVDFIAWTHGNERSMVLLLEDPFTEDDRDDSGADINFEISMKEGFEDVHLLADTRKPSPIPPVHLSFSLSDIQGEAGKRHIKINGVSDTITYEVIENKRPDHQTFSFVDTRRSGAGDYYYVRVKLADDNLLISSPVYVGGYDIE